MTREEHLEWAKKRALKYLDRGEILEAFTSMGSDLTKHPDLKCPNAIMYLGILYVKEYNVDGLRRWIEGFR